MTFHVVYSHQCGGCSAFYIPYDAVPCPRCGLVEAERFDYIPQATASLRINKESCGSYTPPAWWVGSLGDHILSLLFGLFDGYEAQGQGQSFEGYVTERLAAMRWGDQEYLRDHVRDISLRIRAYLNLP
jgi:hypothetical protein